MGIAVLEPEIKWPVALDQAYIIPGGGLLTLPSRLTFFILQLIILSCPAVRLITSAAEKTSIDCSVVQPLFVSVTVTVYVPILFTVICC